MLGRQSIIGHRRSVASLERDPLLVAHHPGQHGRPSFSRRASVAVFTSTHEEGEVSVVELFSDLVVVVALHNMADKLGEGELDLPMYFFQVFLLGSLWHSCIIMTNVANIYTANALQSWHIMVIFFVMAMIVLLTKVEEPLYILIAYGLGRSAQVAATIAIGYSQRPVWVDHEWHENLVYLSTFLVPLKALIENVPLIFTLSMLHNEILVLLGCVASQLIGAGLQIYSAYRHDEEEKQTLGSSKVLDVEHLMERYELIVLILFGELCFAAASDPGAYYLSLCSLVTVFACFLLYFQVRVPDREESWTRSALTNVLCQHLHMLLMAIVPLLSVGYTRLIMHKEGKDEADGMDHDGWAPLHWSTAGYLWIMGLVDLTSTEPTFPTKRPRWKRPYRLGLRTTAGVVVACLVWLPGNSDAVAGTIVSTTLLTQALVEIWAVQLVDISPREENELMRGLSGRRRPGILTDVPISESDDSSSVDAEKSIE